MIKILTNVVKILTNKEDTHVKIEFDSYIIWNRIDHDSNMVTDLVSIM